MNRILLTRAVAALALVLTQGCVSLPEPASGAGGEDMVQIVRLKASHTEFMRIRARDFDQARYEKSRARLGPERLEVVSLSQFEANAARYVLPAIKVNDYPDVDIVAGIREFVRRYPATPIDLTWNGGVGLNLDDGREAEKTYAQYLADPEAYETAGVRDPRSDPLHPEKLLQWLPKEEVSGLAASGKTTVYGRIRWFDNGEEASFDPPPLILNTRMLLARPGVPAWYAIKIGDDGSFVADMPPGGYVVHRVSVPMTRESFNPRLSWGFIVPDRGGPACLGTLVVEARYEKVMLSRHYKGADIRVDDDCESQRGALGLGKGAPGGPIARTGHLAPLQIVFFGLEFRSHSGLSKVETILLSVGSEANIWVDM
jgi:hypothetical protein